MGSSRDGRQRRSGEEAGGWLPKAAVRGTCGSAAGPCLLNISNLTNDFYVGSLQCRFQLFQAEHGATDVAIDDK